MVKFVVWPSVLIMDPQPMLGVPSRTSHGHCSMRRGSAASSTMDLGHGAVVWVVMRVVGHERLGGAVDVEHLLHCPQLTEAQSARVASAPYLDSSKHFALARPAVAVRRDDAAESVVVELEKHEISDGGADDRMIHQASRGESRWTMGSPS